MAEPVLQEDVLVNFIVGDEKLEAMAKNIAKHIGGLQSETEKLTTGKYFANLGMELAHVGSILKDFSISQIMNKATQDTEAMLRAIKGIGASAGMTQKQFAEMNAGIAQAAAETGLGFDSIAAHAKDLYGTTGLKEGLGQTVLDAERLGQVFDTSGTSFSKLTANMIQFGEGTVKADDVMKSFDKTTGITGRRMDDMLEALTDISKTMRNVVGGGKQFGGSMKQITAFSTQVAAKFTEMGGDGASLNELMKDVMDPNKWGDIAQKMPGMAGSLYDMQQAMASGDMEKFGKLMQQGAQATADMGAGMPVVARAASGMDFSSAEMLAKIDFKKIGKDASSGSDVMARSSEMVRSMGEEWSKFVNNMSKSLMPVFLPVITVLSTVLSWLNRLMQAGDGWAGIIITWGIIFAGVIASVAMLTKRLAKDVVKTVVESAGEAGKGLGKAAGTALSSFMETLGKGAQTMAKYAIPLMQVGVSLILFAGAVWILAEAMVTLTNVDMGKAAVGLLLIVGAMAVFAIGAALLAPVAPAMIVVGAAMLLFSASAWILAKAMGVVAPSFELMIGSLGKMSELPLFTLALGICALSGALGLLLIVGTAWGTIGILAGIALAALGAALTVFGWAAKNMGDVLTRLPGDLTNLYAVALMWATPVGWVAGAALTALGAALKPISDAVKGAGGDAMKFANALNVINSSAQDLSKLNTIDMSGLGRLANGLRAFSQIKIDVAVNAKSTEGIKALIGIVRDVSAAVVDIVSTGQMAMSYSGQMAYIFFILFDKDNGILVKAVTGVYESLEGGWWKANKDITKGVQESLNFVVNLLTTFSSSFIDLTVMGMMLAGTTSKGGNVASFIRFAIETIADIVAEAIKTVDKKLQTGINSDITDNIQKSMSFILKLMSDFSEMFIDLTVMGMMLSGTTSKGGNVGAFIRFAIDYVIDTISGVMQQIDSRLQHFMGNDNIAKNVQESFTFVIDIFNKFNAIFVDLAVMGMMLASGAKGTGGVADSIDLAISSVFGDDGFLNRMIDGIRGSKKVDTKVVSEMGNAIKGIGDMVNPLIGITAMGGLFKKGESENLYAFADTTSTFLQKMNAAVNDPKVGDLAGMTAKLENFGAALTSLKMNAFEDMNGKMDGLSSDLSNDIKISTKTGADLALEDHTTATATHQKNVEDLLANIRDGIERLSGHGSPAVAATNGNVPHWRPDSLFTEVSETF